MSNFIINLSRSILLLILSVSSQVSISMEAPESFETPSPLKRARVSSNSGSGEETLLDTSFGSSSSATATSLEDPRVKQLFSSPNFTFTPHPKSTPLGSRRALSLAACAGKSSEIEASSLFEGDWYQKLDTGNWVLNLGSGNWATIIPGKPVELLFGSNAYTKIFRFDTVEDAKLDTEEMARTSGFPFKKKSSLPVRKKAFSKRR